VVVAQRKTTGTNQKRVARSGARISKKILQPFTSGTVEVLLFLVASNRWPSLRYDHRLLSRNPLGCTNRTSNLKSLLHPLIGDLGLDFHRHSLHVFLAGRNHRAFNLQRHVCGFVRICLDYNFVVNDVDDLRVGAAQLIF